MGIAPGRARFRSRRLTIAPWARVGDALTTAMRKEIQREGTFQLATREAGISSSRARFYTMTVARSVSANGCGDRRDYKVSFTAHVVARSRITGKVVLERDMTGNTLMRVGNDLPSAERQTLPLGSRIWPARSPPLWADGSGERAFYRCHQLVLLFGLG